MQFSNDQSNDPTPATKLGIDDLVHGVTLAKADKLTDNDRQPTSTAKEPIVSITRSKVDVMLRK